VLTDGVGFCRSNIGDMSYHSAHFKVEKRFSKNFFFLGTYTYPHFVDGSAGGSANAYPQFGQLRFHGNVLRQSHDSTGAQAGVLTSLLSQGDGKQVGLPIAAT
jgi:hypothetical protein